MGTDSWIQAYTVDDVCGVKSFGFGVGIQLIEIGHTKCQIGIGKEFHCFCFGKAHIQSVDILFDGTLLQ